MTIDERNRMQLQADVEDAKDTEQSCLRFLRSVWTLVMGDTPGPPPFDVALQEIEERLAARDAEQRQKGAVWALELCGSTVWRYLVERGEMKVPE
jgi:hypothetical protein